MEWPILFSAIGVTLTVITVGFKIGRQNGKIMAAIDNLDKRIDERIGLHPIAQGQELKQFQLKELMADNRTNRAALGRIELTLARMEGHQNGE